jgi:membrane dipeptidase
MGAEGGHQIGSSLGVLRQLQALGVSYLTLTHNSSTSWADSATDEPRCGGLSPFGHAVVHEMNRLGMLVDLSHVADTTMVAALDTSTAPVIFSHSSARALTDVTRNVPDHVLARLATNGGTCMVTFVPEFVSPPVASWRDEAILAAAEVGVSISDYRAFVGFCADWAVAHPKPQASLADVVAHVEHVRAVAGVDHVGLGGDFDGSDTYPVGLADVSGYPALFEELAARSWSSEDLRKLAGENILRTLGDAESVAESKRY